MEWLPIIGIVVGILLIIVWAVVGTMMFMTALFWSGDDNLFGTFIACAVWPVLLPLSFILDKIQERRLDKQLKHYKETGEWE
jgi:hypothetical protein